MINTRVRIRRSTYSSRLIALVNPISAAAAFATLTEGRSAAEQAQIARRATIVAGIALIAFAFAGEALLNALGVEIGAFKIAGGLLLLRVAFNMVFAERSGSRQGRAKSAADRTGSIGLSAGDSDDQRSRRADRQRDADQSRRPVIKYSTKWYLRRRRAGRHRDHLRVHARRARS